MMKVRDVMATDPVTLAENDHLDLADDIMTLGRIRHLPVARDGVVIGVLSQRDLFRAAASSVLNLKRAAQQSWLERVAVRDVMSKPPVTIGPETDVGVAVALMLERRIGCLPVVGEDGNLHGLLSETDCLRVLKRILDNAAVRERLAELAPE
jgi:acetoin utilization protein AcuB